MMKYLRNAFAIFYKRLVESEPILGLVFFSFYAAVKLLREYTTQTNGGYL
jgi:hypothetical protein